MMSNFVFIIIVIAAPLTFAQIGEKCTPNRTFSTVNFIPHSSNCSKFLSCDNGIFVEMECPARLHFNPMKKICDWPALAGCIVNTNEHKVPEVDEPEEEAVLGRRCLPSNIRNSPKVAAYPSTCEQFLICAGIWTLMNCPQGLLFSVETGHCEYPETAKCCPTCATTLQKCSKDGVRLANPTDCHKFYICKNETMVDLICAEGMIFSAIKGECVDGTSCASLSLPPTDNLPFCRIEGALYPNYENCKKFFICNGGTIVDQSCPPNKFFSIKHNNCQWKMNAICADELKLKMIEKQ